jgi:hypothetical protein
MSCFFHFILDLIVCERRLFVFLGDEPLDEFFSGFVGIGRDERVEGKEAVGSGEVFVGEGAGDG